MNHSLNYNYFNDINDWFLDIKYNYILGQWSNIPSDIYENNWVLLILMYDINI